MGYIYRYLAYDKVTLRKFSLFIHLKITVGPLHVNVNSIFNDKVPVFKRASKDSDISLMFLQILLMPGLLDDHWVLPAQQAHSDT